MLKTIVSVLAYQATWAACAYGAVHGLPQVGVLACFACIALGFLFARSRLGLLSLVLALGLFGLVAETIILSAGLTTFSSHSPYSTFAPTWIVGLWMAFATLIEPAFGWLRGRLLIAGALGATAGPVSYYAAVRLGALHINQPEWIGLFAIGFMWTVAMPLAVSLSKRFQENS